MEAQVARNPYHAIGRFGRGRVREIALGGRDLDLLFALFTHGTLSSEMLRAVAAPSHSQRATTKRLFLLRNPPNEFVMRPEC